MPALFSHRLWYWVNVQEIAVILKVLLIKEMLVWIHDEKHLPCIQYVMTIINYIIKHIFQLSGDAVPDEGLQ